MTTTTTPTTAELLAAGIGEAVRPDKSGYARIVVYGRTIAYADDRADGVMLSLDEGDFDNAAAVFEQKAGRYWLRVTADNVDQARAFLAWLAIATPGAS